MNPCLFTSSLSPLFLPGTQNDVLLSMSVFLCLAFSFISIVLNLVMNNNVLYLSGLILHFCNSHISKWFLYPSHLIDALLSTFQKKNCYLALNFFSEISTASAVAFHSFFFSHATVLPQSHWHCQKTEPFYYVVRLDTVLSVCRMSAR